MTFNLKIILYVVKIIQNSSKESIFSNWQTVGCLICLNPSQSQIVFYHFGVFVHVKCFCTCTVSTVSLNFLIHSFDSRFPASC